MKMRRLLLLTLIIALIGCKKQPTNSTFFTGFFPNSKDSLVILYANDIAIDTTFLNKDKNFTFSLNIKESKLYNFEIGGKYQYIYLEPLDSLVVYANILRFEESISFSGKGAAINNFLLSQLNNIDIQSDELKKYHSLPPIAYKEKIDSILMIKKRECDNFIKNHPYLSDKAKNIALVSSMFPLYKEIEIYPFIYQDKNKNLINHLLPSEFYNYRKQIDYNNSFLAFTKYTHNNSTLVDVNRELGFHLEKIKIIDSLFDKGSLRDNLYRNAAYAYIFNIQEHAQYQDYFDKFAKYNKDNEHKAELDKVFKNVIALQAGQIPPDFDLIDTKGTLTKFSEIQKPEVTIYYFWSVNQRELSNLIFDRIAQLKSLFPNVKFVGIDIGQDKTQWRKRISENQWTDQYHSINFMDLSQKFLINNINKSVIIDKNGRIISAFEDIFSPNLEKILLYKAS